MLMPGRKYSIANTNYRFGFNGKENDNDIENGAQDYGMRIYDGRLGRFLSVDPITKKYLELTPYQFASDRPIDGNDLDGLEYTPQGRYGPNQIAVDQTAVKMYSNNPAIIQQTSAQLEYARKQQYFSTPSNYYVSPLQQDINNTRTNDAGYNLDNTKKGWLKIAENKTVKKFSNNIALPMVYAGIGEGAGNALGFLLKEAPIVLKEVPIVSKVGFKTLDELGLKDGMKLSSSKVLELGEGFLGKGYKELVPGSGRYVSADGTRVFRMGTGDITGAHGGAPHVNFETLIPNPSKPGKMMVDKNFHIYLKQ